MSDTCNTKYSERNIITEADTLCGTISLIREIWIAPYRPVSLQQRTDSVVYNILYTDTEEAPEFVRIFTKESATTLTETFANNSVELYNSTLNLAHNYKIQKNTNVFKSIARGRILAIVKDYNNNYFLTGAGTGLQGQSLQTNIARDQYDYGLTLTESDSDIGVVQIDSSFLEVYTPAEGGVRMRDTDTKATIATAPEANLNPTAFTVYARFVSYFATGDTETLFKKILEKGTGIDSSYELGVNPYDSESYLFYFRVGTDYYYTPKIPNGVIVDVAVKFDGTELTIESNAFDISPKFYASIPAPVSANTESLIFGAGSNTIIYDFRLFDSVVDLANIPVSVPVFSVGFDENTGLVFQDSLGRFGVIEGYTVDESGVNNVLDNIVWYDILQQPKRVAQ